MWTIIPRKIHRGAWYFFKYHGGIHRSLGPYGLGLEGPTVGADTVDLLQYPIFSERRE